MALTLLSIELILYFSLVEKVGVFWVMEENGYKIQP